MDVNKIVLIAAKAGKIILENGGEIYRVEDTIIRLCRAFDVNDADAVVMPTGIFISATDENNKTISLAKRIHTRKVNLDRVSKVNDLSRKISSKQLSIEEVEKELNILENAPGYKRITNILISGFAVASFALLFGGNIQDSIFAFFIGSIINFITSYLLKIKFNDFFINLIGGFVAASLGILLYKINFIQSMDTVIISSIMLLVPGLLITNAIRDTIAGDLVSGISRALEAFFIAIAIAVGTGMAFKCWARFLCLRYIIQYTWKELNICRIIRNVWLVNLFNIIR